MQENTQQKTERQGSSEASSETQGKTHQFLWKTEDPLSATLRRTLLEAAKDHEKDEFSREIYTKAMIGHQLHLDRKRLMLWAAERGHCDVVELLLKEYEVGYDCMDIGYQKPSPSASINADKESKAVVERTVEKFASLYDSKVDKLETPLLLALKSAKKDVAMLLLRWYETHYKTEPKDKERRTPLWWAAWRGYENVVKVLIQKPKPNINSKDDSGRTPLFSASRNGHTHVVELLLETGKVDADSRDSANRTPLWQAATNGLSSVVK